MENMYAATGANLELSSTVKGEYDPQFLSVGGRIGRLRYLAYHTSAMFIMSIVSMGVTSLLVSSSNGRGGIEWIPLLIGFISVVISIIYARRRLNDIGNSGTMAFLVIIPFVNLLFGLYLIFAPGIEGSNEYGPAPSKNTRAVILGALILPLIFIIGIVAAVALPAYKQYTVRAKAAQAKVEAQAPSTLPNN